MEYSKEVKEFAKVRMEQTPNNTQIARDIKNKFGIDKELDIIRRRISKWRNRWTIEAKKTPIRRLFFDIETGYYQLLLNVWQLKNFQRYFSYKDIVREKEIICISYKWQYEDTVHTLDWGADGKGEKGTYANIDIWIEDDPDQYGNHAGVKQSYKVGDSFESHYIGNGKKGFGWDDGRTEGVAAPDTSSATPEKNKGVQNEPEDDLPF